MSYFNIIQRTGDRSLSFNNTQCFYSPKDDDYLCRYTIKKCHSEKIVSDDSWVHSKIELLPINTDGYSPIVLDDVENYRALGMLRHVILD